MDKEAKLERKREQRHRREISGRLDKSISEYVRYKYPSIYAEAKEQHDYLNSIYPSKKDLTKTVEHLAWKKEAQRQRLQNNKKLELKIQLMQSEKTTTKAVESSTAITGLGQEIPSRNETPVSEETGLPEIPLRNETPVNEETGLPEIPLRNETPVSEETGLPEIPLRNELDEITPSLNQEIPTQVIQEIMDELQADKDLHEFLLDDIFSEDVEMYDSQ